MAKILFFSGAGLSADSGLGVFRGGNGLWDKYDINKVCNIVTWRANYNMVHEFYSKRRCQYVDAEPNKMHKVIAELQNKYGEEKVVVVMFFLQQQFSVFSLFLPFLLHSELIIQFFCKRL